MSATAMCPADIQGVLKQRFPMIMVDRVASLEPGKRIRAIKNVTANEAHFLGHFPGYSVMPGTLIVEAIGQSASILFSKTTGKGTGPDELIVLGSIHEMRFLKPVIPGDRLEIDVRVFKFVGDFAIVDAVVTVEGIAVAQGKLGFARRVVQVPPALAADHD